MTYNRTLTQALYRITITIILEYKKENICVAMMMHQSGCTKVIKIYFTIP
jgi:hypothetical protein